VRLSWGVMDLAEYKEQVERIPFGKRVHTHLYVYREEGVSLGELLDLLLAGIVKRWQIPPEFNVIKFWTDDLKISFLSYPDFLSLAHAALRHAITLDLATGKARHSDYGGINPPILHRKESCLPPEHPMRKEFQTLTEAEEAAGLYAETETIGFRLNWDRLLNSKGLTIRGHSIKQLVEGCETSEVPAVAIDRHKTAMTRYDLSKPVKTLLEYGILKAETTFFDYGCGQGSDVRGLQALGHVADGWDPVHQPHMTKREADIVNMGYVLNVIEDPAKRMDTLVDAYRHARRLLVVSGLIQETVESEQATKYRDGILTRRNTFQKFFEQQELQQYIEDALDSTAVPVALGVFYVFRNPADQHDFLSARSRRAIDWTQISARLGLGGPRTTWKALFDAYKELLNGFGKVALALGRFPAQSEFDRLPEVVEHLGSAKRALRAFVEGGGVEGLDWEEIR
jgi:hypothetical protein